MREVAKRSRPTLILEILKCLYERSIGLVDGSFHAKNQFDPLSRLDRTPTCDRQTGRHRAVYYRASIASRG